MKTWKYLAQSLALILACSLNMSPAPAADMVSNYDWTVQVETNQLERQFQYKNSSLNPVVKSTVTYFSNLDPKASPQAYEKLWFHEGKPLGLERSQKFGIPQAEAICIKVTHKNQKVEYGEYKAAANSILRVWLDASVNKNAVVSVIVPPQSMNYIISELQNQHMTELPPAAADEPVQASMRLHIQDGTPNGPSRTLCYL